MKTGTESEMSGRPQRLGADSTVQPDSAARTLLHGQSAGDLDPLPSYRSIFRGQQEACAKSRRRDILRKLAVIGGACLVAVLAGVALYAQWPRLSRLWGDLRHILPLEDASHSGREAKPASQQLHQEARAESVKQPEPADRPSGEEVASRAPLEPYQYQLTDSLNRRWLLTSSTPEIFAPDESRPGPTHLRLPPPGEQPAAGGLPESSSLKVANAIAAGEELSFEIVGPFAKEQASTYPRQVVTQHTIERGTVVLTARIGPNGSLRDLRLVSGSPVLAGAALGVLRQFRFVPSKAQGRVVEPDRLIRLKLFISTK